IQRPFKHSIKRSYHEDMVNTFMDKIKQKEKDMKLDVTLPVVRDQSVRWLWNAFNAINNKDLVQKSFKNCVARDWDLSYERLTSHEAKETLRNLRTTNPEFWKEL
ncbi:hypothetical protein DFP72DRAFT_750956, partial [Ephemerocybe angulata]